MNLVKKIIIIISLVLTVTATASITAMAAPRQTASASPCRITPFSFSEGIVPARLQAPGNAAAMSWCNFLQIISNVIGLLYAIVIPIVAIMILFGGAIFITAGGKEGQIQKGKAFLTSAIIGLIIALSAGIIVGLIIRGLGVVEGTTLMPWLF